jgi:hypothetical protein
MMSFVGNVTEPIRINEAMEEQRVARGGGGMLMAAESARFAGARRRIYVWGGVAVLTCAKGHVSNSFGD